MSYRVQLVVGMDTLNRDFSEALTAVRSYCRFALLAKACPKAGMVIRLWNKQTDRIILATDGWGINGDKDVADALLLVGAEEE